MLNKDSIRELFNNLNNVNHLAACSRSPMLKTVRESFEHYISDVENFGNPWELWSDKVDEARELFAKLINADKSEIAALYSVSSCLNAIISSFNFNGKNEVITSDLEYPTTNFILNAYKKYGLKLKTLKNKNNEISIDNYYNNITENTLLTTAIHVSSMNGSVQNINEISIIAHKNNSYIYIDDYQSLGSVNMDVRKNNIDFLASGNLKWLLGVSGIAFLYVNKKISEDLFPADIGWFSQKDPFNFGSEELDYASGARRFENGTWSIPSVYASIEGMKTIIKYRNYIENENKNLFKYAMELINKNKINTITPENAANIIAIPMKDPFNAEAKLKSKYNIITSARGSSLRIAPHFYNTLDEIENALKIIKKEFLQ